MPLTTADLNNAKADVDHIGAIATSLSPTAVDRLGQTKKTITGVLSDLAQANSVAIAQMTAVNDRGPWATATAYNVKDLVVSGGVYYVATVNHISSATFAADLATKWRVYQSNIQDTLAGATGADFVAYTVTGGYKRTLGSLWRDRVNVKNFGATGDGIAHPLSERFATLAAAQVVYPHATALTDVIDWCAYQAAVNSVPTGSSYPVAIHGPSGLYVLPKGVDATGRDVIFTGDGWRATTLLVTANVTALKLDAVGCPGACIGAMNLAIAEVGTRTGMVGVSARNAGDFFLQDVYITTAGKAMDVGSAANDVTFTMLSMVRVECYGAQEAIRFRCGGGCWSNVYARKSRTQGVTGPCVWISGQSTSLQVSNSAFGGKGTAKATKINSIAGFATFFDVAIPGNTALVGEMILIRGTGTGYDGVWKVALKNDVNTIRVTSNINLGNLTPANAWVDKLHAIVYLDNSTGPVNESVWSNTLLEGIDDGGSAGGTGSVSLYLDASGGTTSIAGHQFNGLTYDGGQTGVYMLGKHIGGGDFCISDIRLNGMITRYARIGIHMREVRGIHITGFAGDCMRGNANAADLLETSAIYLDGVGAQPSQGIFINQSFVGRQSGFHLPTIASFSPNNGLRIGGVPQDLRLNGSHFFGLTNSVLIDGGGVIDPATRLMDNGCTYASGAGGETTATRIPVIASAATITLPFGDEFIVNGTTTITTIAGGWVGREVQIAFASSLSLATGGNIGRAVAVVGSQLVTLRFNGTTWNL